ncbi:phage-related tail fiber protein [Caballeronia temeraria]|uniref:Phage-related tail fiber protein n=1 Tax=Caballeronia temeraria TaxID=1777137 RepID=A0A158DQ00_9BURK|nr:tail fiber protein [Caballeronia temeraria]SAK95827.1 phage-related tail fiber protein [Caballeronia temeraria]
MALETGTYISDLVAANPVGSDPIAFADDHLRLIKSTLLNTFPKFKGVVSATHENLSNGTPVGLIAMWSGTSIPAGWALCNGQTVAKADGSGNITTPDLRDRFAVCSGGSYAVGNIGGAASVALTAAQMPVHNHTAWTDTQGSHAHGGSTTGVGDHQHSLPNLGSVQAGGDNGGANVPVATGYSSGRYMSPTDPAGGHSHGITTDVQGAHGHNVGVGNAGSGAAHENRPPYYALAFIMKI